MARKRKNPSRRELLEGQLSELVALVKGAPLSPASLLRLKTQWQQKYTAWKQRRLDDLEVVYLWADGLYVKAGLEDTKAALLVMIGVLTNGQRQSSWR